eukprot:TRINITY_DN8837_c0_g1_i1.p1 TRINITY_DN8837_c0_g1~~TRINITY_DN8837_c0_g1_i1.p1  ORF type:complete len:202 (+),score=25.14 TRINITY_DN8837_c0_g1_i1:70-675(+)
MMSSNGSSLRFRPPPGLPPRFNHSESLSGDLSLEADSLLKPCVQSRHSSHNNDTLDTPAKLVGTNFDKRAFNFKKKGHGRLVSGLAAQPTEKHLANYELFSVTVTPHASTDALLETFFPPSPFVPTDNTTVVVSRGSRNHFEGQCRPCWYGGKPGKCPDAELCNFCHFDHDIPVTTHCICQEKHDGVSGFRWGRNIRRCQW